MEGPIKQLYEKDGKEFKPIRACDCAGGGSGDGGGGSTGGGGSLPDNISAEATAFETSTVSATAEVDQETGVFRFRFGLKPGAKGDKGDKGEKGDSGETPVARKTVMAFKTSVETPSTPVGGSWDVITDVVTYPNGWSTTDGIAKPIWMSTGEFSSAAPNNPTWSKPIKISGDDGANGTDGVATEFIYKLTETNLVTPDKPESVNQTEFVPTGWTDYPSGISEEMQCEWVCSRKKDDFDNWGDWDGPVIWAKWGANGQDGDGVEYIYKVNNGEALENPTPDDYATNTDYQNKDTEYVPSGWTDNPTGVSANNTHEWVCARKFRNGKWQAFSNPALWAKYGENGYNGINIRTMYAKTNTSENVPVVVTDNINPGSIWGLAIPNYNSPEAIWSIWAYVNYKNELVTVTDDENNEVYGWQGPVLVSGVAGKDGADGVAPNYKTYVYKLSDTKPAAPTGTNLVPDGWQDYPNTTGQWWQCVGVVNGFTNTVESWGEVIPLNGKDGTAQDGKHTEFRFAVNDSQTDCPTINVNLRSPDGWSTTPPTLEDGQFLWMTVATINPDDTLDGTWATPVRISGESGPKGDTGPAGPAGPTGSQGISGIPGVSIEVRYCLGTKTSYDGSTSPSGDNPTGWLTSTPNITTAKPYIWCIQGRREYADVNDATGTIVWSTPFRLSGINGLDGAPGADGATGKKGQIIYPAGIYDPSATYVTDDDKAPYVYYTSTGKFYVLNAKMSWVGTEQTTNPSNSSHWVEFDDFDAIYAKIGIIANGLIGSAVFNDEWMFSQHGITTDGAATSNYENFNPVDPYNKSNNFRPNWCVNLKTGAQWLDAGNIIFYTDEYSESSSAKLGNWYITKGGHLTGDVDGTGYKVLNFSPDLGLQITGTQGYKMWLKSDGSGYLASGNIEWDANGIIDKLLVGDTSNNTADPYTEIKSDGVKTYVPGSSTFTGNGVNGFYVLGQEGVGTEVVVGQNTLYFNGGILVDVTQSDASSGNIQFVSTLPENADDNTLYVLI